MGLIMPAIGGLVFGIICYFLLPILIGTVDRDRVPLDHYIATSMGILGRGLAIKRKHGGWWLKQSTFDSKFGKEKTSINGETQHFDDPEALMSQLHGWPFGMAHEESGTIINPRYSELGEVVRDRARDGSLFYEHDGETLVNGYVRVADAADRLVDVDNALAVLSGDANPGTTKWSKEITEKSQHPFKSGSFVDYMGGIVALGASFGMVWMASKVVDDGVGSTIEIGMIDLLGSGAMLV